MGIVFHIHILDNAAPTESDTSTDEVTPSSEQDTTEDLDFQATWSQDFEGYDPGLAPAPSGTTHEYTFDVTEEPIEVAAGVTQTRWTLNGASTGPTLRGKIGDKFKITLVNSGSMGHAVDFHASHMAPDERMRTIESGESLE